MKRTKRTSKAAALLRKGEVIAVATDTVFGLAAKGDNLEAIERLFALKKRELHQPLILQCASIEEVLAYTSSIPPHFEELARHWPGALTLVIPIDEQKVPSLLRAGQNSLGFRIPNHPPLLSLLRETGPLAITSANPSGKPAATSQEQVETYFGKDFPLFHTEEKCQGVASTVLAYDQKWRVVREGSIQIIL